MTVTLISEQHKNRGGKLEMGSGGSFTRCFRVQTTDPENEGPYEVCFAAGMPSLGDPFPSNPLYTLRSITPSPLSDPSVEWLATCEYSRNSGNPDDEPDNPLNEPVQISVRGNKVTKAPIRDLDLKKFVNTVGDPFETAVEIERTYPVVVFTRNEPAFGFESHAKPFLDRVNNGSYLGGATGTVKCTDLSAEKHFSEAMEYWQVRYEFSYNPDGWQPQVLNAGYYFKDAGERNRCVDVDGRDTASPMPLTESGSQIAPSGIPAQLHYIEFRMYESANFGSLGLPT